MEVEPWTAVQVSLEDAQAVTAAAQARGSRVCTVDLSAVNDKAAMLSAIGTALQFPEYYGANLDALYDCLGDMLEAALPVGIIIVITNAPPNASAASADFEKIVEVVVVFLRDAHTANIEARLVFSKRDA